MNNQCEWVDPFDANERCERGAEHRVSFRAGDDAEIIIPERKLCTPHKDSVCLGIERNYRGRRGTLRVDEL